MKRSVLRCGLRCCLLPLPPAAASTDGPVANWALERVRRHPRPSGRCCTGGTPGVLMGTSPASLLFIGGGGCMGRPWHGGGRGAGGAVLRRAGAATRRGRLAGGAQGRARRAAARRACHTERPGRTTPASPTAWPTRSATPPARCRPASPATAPPRRTCRPGWRGRTPCSPPAPARCGAAAPCRTRRRPGCGPTTSIRRPPWLSTTAPTRRAAAASPPSPPTPASPWHGRALSARARPAAAGAGDPHGATSRRPDAAAALPADGPFHASAAKLGGMAQLHADPAAAATRLIAALGAAELDRPGRIRLQGPAIARQAARRRSCWTGSPPSRRARPPRPCPPDSPGSWTRPRPPKDRRAAALAHARDRYGATHDPAWLLASARADAAGRGRRGTSCWPMRRRWTRNPRLT